MFTYVLLDLQFLFSKKKQAEFRRFFYAAELLRENASVGSPAT
jgi:hypothetical protein